MLGCQMVTASHPMNELLIGLTWGSSGRTIEQCGFFYPPKKNTTPYQLILGDFLTNEVLGVITKLSYINCVESPSHWPTSSKSFTFVFCFLFCFNKWLFFWAAQKKASSNIYIYNYIYIFIYIYMGQRPIKDMFFFLQGDVARGPGASGNSPWTALCFLPMPKMSCAKP